MHITFNYFGAAASQGSKMSVEEYGLKKLEVTETTKLHYFTKIACFDVYFTQSWILRLTTQKSQ